MARWPLVFLLFSGLLRAETVLVIPFYNHSKNANLDWIGASIAESLRETLASQDMLVLDREDRLEAYRRLSLRPNAELTRASVIKAGEALDASQVVYGWYDLSPAAEAQAARGTLRITARILDLQRTRQGPEYTELGALEDIAALETHLGWQTLQFLAPNKAPPEEEFRRARHAVRVDAIESYIRGLLAASPEQKHRFFTQAARLDENYSQPCFQLGKIYSEKKDYRVAAGWLERVRPSDPHYLEAQFFLGLSKHHMGDYEGAAKSFALVAASVPLNEVYNNLGAAESRRNLPSAVEHFRKALEGDSADPDYHFNLGYALWKAGQFDAAVASFRSATERNPSDTEATSFLGRALKKEGPRAGDPRTQGRERLKTNYEETAYRQLKAELESKK